MPYVQRINTSASLSTGDKQQMLIEFNALRQELDEMRAAFMSLRALLVAATAPGAGYNTTPTNLGPTTPLTVAAAPRFTPN